MFHMGILRISPDTETTPPQPVSALSPPHPAVAIGMPWEECRGKLWASECRRLPLPSLPPLSCPRILPLPGGEPRLSDILRSDVQSHTYPESRAKPNLSSVTDPSFSLHRFFQTERSIFAVWTNRFANAKVESTSRMQRHIIIYIHIFIICIILYLSYGHHSHHKVNRVQDLDRP